MMPELMAGCLKAGLVLRAVKNAFPLGWRRGNGLNAQCNEIRPRLRGRNRIKIRLFAAELVFGFAQFTLGGADVFFKWWDSPPFSK